MCLSPIGTLPSARQGKRTPGDMKEFYQIGKSTKKTEKKENKTRASTLWQPWRQFMSLIAQMAGIVAAVSLINLSNFDTYDAHAQHRYLLMGTFGGLFVSAVTTTAVWWDQIWGPVVFVGLRKWYVFNVTRAIVMWEMKLRY